MARVLPRLEDGEQLAFFECGGSWSYLRTPTAFISSPSRGRPIPLLIRCRGLGGFVRMDEADWQVKPEQKIVVDELVRRGYAVAGSDLSGDHWGRPAGVAENASLHNLLTEHANVDPWRIGMFTGAGMGGLALWNSVIGPLHGKIKAAVLIQAVVSLPAMFPARRINIMSAYGIAINIEDTIAIASLALNDPIGQTRSLLSSQDPTFAKGLPKTLCLHGDKDKQVDYRKNALALTLLLREHGVNSSLETFDGRGHELHTLGEQVAKIISNFFDASLI